MISIVSMQYTTTFVLLYICFIQIILHFLIISTNGVCNAVLFEQQERSMHASIPCEYNHKHSNLAELNLTKWAAVSKCVGMQVSQSPLVAIEGLLVSFHGCHGGLSV